MTLSSDDYRAVIGMIHQYTKNHEHGCKFWIDQHFVALYYDKESQNVFKYWNVQKQYEPLSREGIYTCTVTTPPFIREIYFRMDNKDMSDSEWRKYQDQFRVILIKSKLFSRREVLDARITNLLDVYTVEWEKIKPQDENYKTSSYDDDQDIDQEKEKTYSWFYKILNVLDKVYF